MSQRIAVLYHRNCPDGFGAAFAAWQTFKDQAKYLSVMYGESFPLDQLLGVEEVYIVDFSYPPDVLLAAADTFKTVVVIDHHKGVYDQLQALIGVRDNLTILFDNDKSGAVLTYEHFFPASAWTPVFLRYIQDRDLWTWQLEDSREFSAALSSYPHDFETWHQLALDVEGVIKEGRGILRANNQQIHALVKNAYFANIAGHKVPVVNSASFMSELGNELCKAYPDAPFAGVYYDQPDGKRKWSLRSIGKEARNDVSAICRLFGGNGHHNAAGFTEYREEGGTHAKEVVPPVVPPTPH